MQHRSHNSELRDHARLLVEIEQAQEVILQQTDLSAADKWAWRYLAMATRNGRQIVSTTATAVAGYEGRSTAAGRQRLKNLEAAGLIAVRGDGPTYEIELLDTDAVPLRRMQWDGQLELFDHEDEDVAGPEQPGVINLVHATAEPPLRADAHPRVRPTSGSLLGSQADGGAAVASEAAVAAPIVASLRPGKGAQEPTPGAQEPVQVPAQEPTRNLRASRTRENVFPEGKNTNQDLNLNINLNQRLNPELSLSRPRVREGSQEPAQEPTAIGNVLGALPWGMPDADRVEGEVAKLAGWISKRVADPRLDAGLVNRIAWAIVEGRIERHVIDGLLCSLERARASGSLQTWPARYFGPPAKRILERALASAE